MSDAKTTSLLLKAAQVVRSKGLAKKMYIDADGRVCILGALNCALTGMPYSDRLSLPAQDSKREMTAAVKDVISSDPSLLTVNVVTEFNDKESTTAEDVITVLEQAAASFKKD